MMTNLNAITSTKNTPTTFTNNMSTTTTPQSNRILKKILFLHVPILFCLFILTDHETNYTYYSEEVAQDKVVQPKRHLAVFTALSRHPPSMRIYRGIFEFLLLGFCAAFCLYVWECIFDERIITKLLFDCPYTLRTDDDEALKYGVYELADEEDEEGDANEETGTSENANDKETNQDEEHEGLEFEEVEEEEKVVKLPIIQNNTPSSTRVLNKALDALLLTMISLFFFTISSSAGGQYIDNKNGIVSIFMINNDDNSAGNNITILSQFGLIAAPMFPLMLFFIFAIQLFLPWNTSKFHFWTCISYTLGAPLYDVTFRDGFIGDIFTSMVRPMQDIAYTCFYLLSGLNGWWVYQRSNLDGSTLLQPSLGAVGAASSQLEEDLVLQPVEHSWLLHTIVLPACMVSPLWWRYCQTLKQCYDTKKRWPYLGNSFKYFLAAQVAIFGVFFDPNKRDHFFAWLFFYIVATMYQILWDVFMDWELFTLNNNGGWSGLMLRTKRMYSSKRLYIFILVVNIILRFGWILNFIPTRYLSSTGALEYTFSVDFTTMISPMLACGEILRRMLWGLIRFELEAIKTMEKEEEEKRGLDCFQNNGETGGVEYERGGKKMNVDHDGVEMTSMSVDTKMKTLSTSSFKSLTSIRFRNDLSTANEVEILWEVCVYATVFAFMGTIAAIHRQVL